MELGYDHVEGRPADSTDVQPYYNTGSMPGTAHVARAVCFDLTYK